MLTGNAAGHATNTISLEDKTLARQMRALKAIFTRFLTAANIIGIANAILSKRTVLRPDPRVFLTPCFGTGG